MHIFIYHICKSIKLHIHHYILNSNRLLIITFIQQHERESTNSYYICTHEVTKRVYFIGNERMLIAHDSNRLRFS